MVEQYSKQKKGDRLFKFVIQIQWRKAIDTGTKRLENIAVPLNNYLESTNTLIQFLETTQNF